MYTQLQKQKKSHSLLNKPQQKEKDHRRKSPTHFRFHTTVEESVNPGT